MDKLLEVADVALVAAIVTIIQMGKRWMFPKIPKWAWFFVALAAGVFAAWLKIPRVDQNWKLFEYQSIIYAGAIFIVYGGYETAQKARGKR
jgi:hypothetical protein